MEAFIEKVAVGESPDTIFVSSVHGVQSQGALIEAWEQFPSPSLSLVLLSVER